MPDPPTSVPLGEFLTNGKYGRTPFADSRPPITCGISGLTYTHQQQQDRINLLARALSHELGWAVNTEPGNNKILGIFSFNTIDYMTVAHAAHRLNGIVSLHNAAQTAADLQHQLLVTGAKVLVTCIPLLETAVRVAKAVGIPRDKVYIMDLPKDFTPDVDVKTELPLKTINTLIDEGRKLPALERLNWSPCQGRTQPAFLLFSSGTSGLPKCVQISHYNLIASVLQISTFDRPARLSSSSCSSSGGYRKGKGKGNDNLRVNIVLGLMPMSHIYGLVMLASYSHFQGDQVIIIPKFTSLPNLLSAVQRFRINTLFLVPPLILSFLANHDSLVRDKGTDLGSVRSVFTGAAPLAEVKMRELRVLYPAWSLHQGYGTSETSLVSRTAEHDVWFGTSGSLLPGVEARLVGPEGREITALNTMGELLVRGPGVMMGYLADDANETCGANGEALITTYNDDGKEERWYRTGDEAMFVLSKGGWEHLVITERIKELIKVNGRQVAPAELEAFIWTHPLVADVAVIGVPHCLTGETAKAFVVRKDDELTAEDVVRFVEEGMARYKRLGGGVEFVDAVPRSPSGKILRRVLRERERKGGREKVGAKL
jgi:acyl-CoA synthetase (AMP-forming)/AMP-acid ligase II